MTEVILLGAGEHPCHLLLSRANRHGLIAGATGTGKTVTLQSLAEGFSRAGVPVFAADIKGDLSGIAAPGKPNPKLEARDGSWAWRTTPMRPRRSSSGTSSASRATRCGRRSPRW